MQKQIFIAFCRGGVSKTKSKIVKFPFHLSGKSDDSTVRPKNPPGTGPAVCSLLTKRSEEPPVSGNSSPILFPKILPANRLSENHTVLCGIEPQQLQQRLFLEAAPCNGLQTVSGGIKVHVLRISARIGRAPETDAVHRLIPVRINAVIGHIHQIERRSVSEILHRGKLPTISFDDPVQYIRFRIVTIHTFRQESIDPNGIERHSRRRGKMPILPVYPGSSPQYTRKFLQREHLRRKVARRAARRKRFVDSQSHLGIRRLQFDPLAHFDGRTDTLLHSGTAGCQCNQRTHHQTACFHNLYSFYKNNQNPEFPVSWPKKFSDIPACRS